MVRPSEPLDLVVHDVPEPCPYLPGEQARMPLRLPVRALAPGEVDASLARGDRRVGPFLYRTACTACHACEPLRVPVASFALSASLRRVARRNADLSVEVAAVSVDDARVELFNRHRTERGLGKTDDPLDAESYTRWFADSCVPTIEMTYRLRGRLLAVGILDVGAEDASSVYFFFDPDARQRSLGTYGVLAEVAWLRVRGGRFHYLGLHVAACRHLAYKARFRPHERLIDGGWVQFGR